MTTAAQFVTPIKPVLLVNDDGSMSVFLAEPRECGTCREMHAIFVTRHGATMCTNCDHEKTGIFARPAITPAPYEPRQGSDVWLPGTSVHAAIGWSLKELSNNLVLLLAALIKREPSLADARCRDLRHTVTRLEAFVRLRKKQWEEMEPRSDASHARNRSGE